MIDKLSYMIYALYFTGLLEPVLFKSALPTLYTVSYFTYRIHFYILPYPADKEKSGFKQATFGGNTSLSIP